MSPIEPRPRQRRPFLRPGCCLLLLTLTASPPQPSWALVIHRFGGADLAPPDEIGQQGVVFVQHSWEELASASAADGAEWLDLDPSSGALRPLRRDPQVDIAPTTESLGGIYVRPHVNAQVWDGDTSTVWDAVPYICADIEAYTLTCTDDFGTPGTANITLAGQYQLDHLRLKSGLRDPSKVVQSIRVFAAPVMPFVTTTFHPPPFSPYIVEIRDNREPVLDIPLPPQGEVGFVQVTLGEHTEDWEVHDIQIFAKGYVRQARLVSPILDFGRPMAWGELRWAGERDERAKVSVQTRSGADADPLRYWRYTGRGTDRTEVTASQYAALKLGERAGTTNDQDNWSFWSTYDFGDSLGTPVASLSPRRYFQVRVDFEPKEDDAGEVRVLELRASEPVAASLVGEVWPREARVGRRTDFTYILRPTLEPADGGFDTFELQTQSILGQVRGVRVGDVPVDFSIESADAHRVVVRLPRLEPKDSGALVEVDFDAQILRYGSRFEGRVSDSGRPLEVPQSVNDGDASGEFEGNSVAVATAEDDEGQLLRLHADASVLTPNGDGINDGADVAYDVFEITGSARVRVDVYDLAGRLVRRLHDGDDAIGTYQRHWDGRDEAGRLVVPGLYLAAVSLKTDSDNIERTRLLHVTY